MKTNIQLHHNGQWHNAAELVHHTGYQATFEYNAAYVFGGSSAPVSIAIKPTMDRKGFSTEGVAPECPAFIFDLVPQGLGRKYLLQQLNLSNADESDIPLAMYGAFNPIGNIRLESAVDYFNRWVENNQNDANRGFTLDEIVQRSDEFVEHIWLHAMLAAGTTGVQGAAPKFLLTQDAEGLFFADAALADEAARKHWIVKRPRGRLVEDYTILHNEAAYHRVAEKCGLRATGECFVKGDMLFFERFDRLVENGTVIRLHQESIVAVSGVVGFRAGISNFVFAEAIAKYATNPSIELAEFIARDILNRAMKNTDNHGRNTAMQITRDGAVRLTPIYDFAPMYMDPEMIPRSCRWVMNGREVQSVNEILQALHIDDEVRNDTLVALAPFMSNLKNLERTMDESGVDQKIIASCLAAIDAQVKLLEEAYGFAP